LKANLPQITQLSADHTDYTVVKVSPADSVEGKGITGEKYSLKVVLCTSVLSLGGIYVAPGEVFTIGILKTFEFLSQPTGGRPACPVGNGRQV